MQRKQTLLETQHPFMIKTISKLPTEGNFLNQIEGIYKILKLTSYLTNERLNPSPPNWEQNKDSTLTGSVCYYSGGSRQHKTGKKNK